VTLLFSLLVMRLADLQIVRGEEFARLANRYHEFDRRLQAPRGRILDRSGNVLGESVPVKSLEIRPRALVDPDEAARRLAEALGYDASSVRKRLASDDRYVLLHAAIESNDVIRRLEGTIRDLDREGIRGIDLHDRYRRYYPFRDEFAHVVGFVGRDGYGLEGIERRFDDRLAGQPGKERVLRDGFTRPFYPADVERVEPEPGSDIVLTLDATLQHFLEREVAWAFEEWRAEGVMGVIVSPRDGKVLALANRPNYDPNLPGESTLDARRNRVVTDAFPPGSTFKAVTLAAGLESRRIRLGEVLDCENGVWNCGGRVVHDVHPNGVISIADVIVESSNIGAAKIGLRVGGSFLRPFCRNLGFGSRSGIRLPGEASGYVASSRDWSEKYTTVSVSFGQEISVTALQLAMAFSAVANGGWLFPPRIVERIVRPDGSVDRLALRMPRRVLDADAAEGVREVLVRVVEEGSGEPARVPGYRVAGKTGTAERIVAKVKSGYVSTFAAFAPASNPAVCVLIMVDRPKGAHYARAVAAPAVGRVLQDALAYLGIPPEVSVEGDPQVGRKPEFRQPSDTNEATQDEVRAARRESAQRARESTLLEGGNQNTIGWKRLRG